MKYICTIILSALLLAACQKNTKQYKLEDSQLVNLMLDLQLVETMVSTIPLNEQDSLKKVFWKQLTSVYNMTEDEIKNEVEQLETDPEKLMNIMNQVKAKTDSLQ